MENPEDSGRWPEGRGPLWLHPDDDLAPNRPGEALHGELAARPAGRLRRVRDRLLLRSAGTDALRAALEAEERAGERLGLLAGAGWRVLHSVPLPGEAAVSHLAIGPAGVLCLRSVGHHGARLAVGEDEVVIDGRRAEPYVRHCRRDARRAAHALGRGCGFPVAVRPVLVCVAAAAVDLTAGPRDVEVLRDGDLDGLAARGGVLKPDTVEAVYGVARARRTWRWA